VFERDSPFQKFEKIDGGHAKGPGITDMKGGDIIMIHALKALKSIGALDRMNVTVVMTGDEESTGRPLARARDALVEAAKGAAAAIGFENGDGDPAHAVVARRGTTSWRLETRRTGHSSGVAGADSAPAPSRSRAHRQCLPREARGRTASDLQPRRLLGERRRV
jgi:glutamate carboxypeptidase